MRRKDREVTGIEELLGIIQKCKVFRLGMTDGTMPYIVPLNFGYEYRDTTLTLYFHGAREGKKTNALKQDNRVCFEMDGEYALTTGELACDYGFNYASVIGFGTVELIEEDAEKIRALNLLMRHQTGENRDFTYGEAQLRAVAVYRLKAETFTGKQRAL
jgi:nitroimidazol reductase NimA-like FMN-containing flavoprotein (pyridoxamine 5'-phosphate oxidase superfamily)